jgi:hypothetical protein
MPKATKPLRIRSANLKEGIDYEVKREIINMQISEKVSEMFKDETYALPTEEDIAELRRLAASRQ